VRRAACETSPAHYGARRGYANFLALLTATRFGEAIRHCTPIRSGAHTGTAKSLLTLVGGYFWAAPRILRCLLSGLRREDADVNALVFRVHHRIGWIDLAEPN
jgi:hypothetical protein